jgi:hypothetical protein
MSHRAGQIGLGLLQRGGRVLAGCGVGDLVGGPAAARTPQRLACARPRSSHQGFWAYVG